MKTDKISFMGIYIDNLNANEMVDYIFEKIENRTPVQIVGVNVDQIVRVSKNELSKKIFLNSSLVFVDGKPIQWMCKLLGTPIKERITGPDLMEFVCAKAASKKYRIFLLGAAPGVAQKCGEILRERYPGVEISGTYSPPLGFQNNEDEMQNIIEMLKKSNSDILFVGMGSPKQDIFIYENMSKYDIPVSFSMGAAIDFISGNVKRAPRWMVVCGLEWFHRMVQNPKRLFKRYLVDDMAIVPLFIKEIFNKIFTKQK